MNKLVKIEELQEGDEIIVASGSTLKYLKLLKNPTLSNKTGWKRRINDQGYFTWDKNSPLYKSILCSTCVKEKTYKYKGHGNNTPDIFKNYKEYIYEIDYTKHNKKVSFNLNHKNILLVKKGEPKKEGIYE
jgi:hypothetical protein